MVIARSVRGMNDLFDEELHVWRFIEANIIQMCASFGFKEIRTPILEDLALFKRSIGEATDIVEKEMFLVHDGEHSYCLRPENTAPVVRALLEKGGLSADSEEKLFYIGPMFRKERPQKGRLRQFHQFGMETFGVAEPIADVEILVMVTALLARLGIKNTSLHINSLGDAHERNLFKSKLHDFLTAKLSLLCEDCVRRMSLNTLRVLDCKKAPCQAVIIDAPKSIEILGPKSEAHFREVLHGLEQQGIPYVINHHLVRGLDYYQRTVFEFVADIGLGSQNAVVAGGRYDGLFKTVGGKFDLPAIGCAGGIERTALLLEKELSYKPELDLAIMYADDDGLAFVPSLVFKLRDAGVSVDFSLKRKSLKAQMRRADKLGASFALVLGKSEIDSSRIHIKSFRDGSSTELGLDVEAIVRLVRREE